jgi:TonB family protein
LDAIFVSYRRSDSQGEAGRVFDDLVNHFGDHAVFMDVVGIEAGRDFRKAIDESVAKCDVLLAVIGPEWLNAKDETGARRLDDPTDFVRIEIASALRRDIAVIPVLVRGVGMPRAEQLPEDLRDLAYRNCIELTHVRWRSDIQLLVDALRRLVGDSRRVGTAIGPSRATASNQPATPFLEAPANSENESRGRIDPGVIQRVSRELALRIGPIADIVVRRAASRSGTIEDLYLKVAEEIDSRDERERFLRERSANVSTALADASEATALSNPSLGASGSSALSEGTDRPFRALEPAKAGQRPSRWKYRFLLGGGVTFIVLMVVLLRWLAAPRGGASSRTAQNMRQETGAIESPPVKVAAPATPVEGLARTDTPSKSSAAGGAEQSEPRRRQPVRVSQKVSMGLLVHRVLPVYPPLARQAHVQGTVVLEADISSEGTVETLKATSGHPMLIPAAIEAAKQWRYKPFVLDGSPVAVKTQIIVNFTLSGG